MSIFHPDVIYDRIYNIDFEKIKEKNIKAIIFDIDNTLAYNKEPQPSKKAKAFLNSLSEKGFKVVIASNNKKSRVKRFCEGLNVLYVHKADKPLGIKSAKLLKCHNIKNKEACIVGDQIFTDVLCGKLAGFYTILVKPFDDNENKFIKFKRRMEKIILKKTDYFKIGE